MAGFDLNYTPGKLAFANGYTIPNPAVRFGEAATIGLWFRNLIGDDIETHSGTVPHPRVEKGIRWPAPVEVSQHANSSGVAATDRVRQLKENLAELATITDASKSDPDGLQTVQYTPWVGATPVALSLVVAEVLTGGVLRGIGVRAAVLLSVPAGAVTGAGP